ncbi:MAG: monofunctional biosynthetic peptidoglycan transglycosylase [Flavobacteriales bacterium]|nr:monofunctional biosynthetic peptidoglycan transglycosylase [Flavobacteriales bacterium]MBP9079622.1 monofunctional biosynthetic peptidoglycan transglycosylase [Flavobacteriales bacterium]
MKRHLISVIRTLSAVLGWALLISILWVLLLRVVPPPVTWVMAEQVGEQGGVQRTWKSWRAFPEAMPMAVIAAEDQLFFQHNGFDIEAMQKALAHNQRSKRVRGASTISQQTAKNVFLWPGRTFLRKGLEAWFTLLVEGLWGKQRILEVYLNIAETGKGRFGVEATAQACLKRSAAKLTPSQCALIAAVLPAPRRYNACRPSPYVKRRQAWIQRQMRQLGNQLDPLERERMQQLKARP